MRQIFTYAIMNQNFFILTHFLSHGRSVGWSVMTYPFATFSNCGPQSLEFRSWYI